jgi:hypothetical protein
LLVIKIVEFRSFSDKTLEFRTLFKEDKADQKLPTNLRMWTDAEYRKDNSPQHERLKTDSDGISKESISKDTQKSQEDVLSHSNSNSIQKRPNPFKMQNGTPNLFGASGFSQS